MEDAARQQLKTATQDLFTCGQNGYHSYRIPALVTTPAGTALAFCEARKHTGRDDDQIDILCRRSTDGGATWTAPQMVVPSGGQTCGNPCPIAVSKTGAARSGAEMDEWRSNSVPAVPRSSGRAWLLFCKNNQRIFTTHSDDEGQTWAEPREITAQAKDPGWSYVGTGPCHGIQLSSGRLLAPCWSDESPGPVTWAPDQPNWGKVQSSYALYSDDRGQTWRHSANITRDASDECAAAELPDGTVYMDMRSRQDKKCRARAFSRDGGETWTPAEYIPALPEPSCQGSILRVGGILYLTHPCNPDDRTQLALYHSRDNGQTFSRPAILYQGPAAYSDLAATDTHLLCLFEADRSRRLVLQRIDLEHLAP